MTTPGLSFRRLVLTGPGRTYDVAFRDGVNLITGPIWTGKSSILQLLDYACGAKTPPSYPELAKCSDVYVECLVGDEVLTIRRSLRSATAKAILYAETIDEIFEHASKGTEVSARHQKDAKSVSGEVLRRLDLGGIEVKAAPTQDASELKAFSLRDLLMLIYVDQDRMGSAKSGFFEDNPHKAIKWRAAFEIVHGLFDELATTLAEALKEAETEEQQLRQYLRHVGQFLDDFKVPSIETLEKALNSATADEERLEEQLRTRRSRTETLLRESYALVSSRRHLDDNHAILSSRIAELKRSLSQLGRLRVQYERERAQLSFLKESEHLVGDLPIIRCPSCLQAVDQRLEAAACYVCHRPLPKREGEVSADARLRSTLGRMADLDGYMEEIETTVRNLESEAQQIRSEVARTDAAIQRSRDVAALPDEEAFVQASEELNNVRLIRRQIEEHLELRKKAEGEGSTLAAAIARKDRLRDALQAAAMNQPSPVDVTAALSTLFVEILGAIEFPERRDSRVDAQTYRPVVRNQSYGQLSSKGAVALAMVAWHLAVLRYSLESRSRFPRLLMLDSPLSHVGHDSKDEQFKDQQIVEAFYASLLALHRSRGGEFQLVLVDNRPPEAAAEMVTVAFTRDPSVGRFGLIDDEHPSLPESPTTTSDLPPTQPEEKSPDDSVGGERGGG